MFLLRLIDRFGLLMGRLVSFLVWAGIVVLCWEVVARYVFGAPTIWAHGYTQRIFGAYFVLVGAYTLIRRDHVRIDLFINGSRPRVNAALDLVNYVFLIVWGVALTWEGFWFFEDAWRYGDLDDSVLQHPMWPIKLCLFAGAALITLQASAEAIRSLVLMANPQADVMRSAPR
jgi:TRAP-type mannitol/chloroaromatic compound transport system permease small subunit